jgi:deoxyadenosine/deoxycytidine kinase
MTNQILVVVFGCPGVGKTTLIDALRANDHYATVPEPTTSERIRTLIADMYEKKPNSAIRLQTAILSERIDAMALGLDATDKKIVVCDGHPMTDLLIYGKLHVQNKTMTVEEYEDYERRIWKSTFMMPTTVFIQLKIGNDENGEKHFHRIHNLRASQEEQSVDMSVFNDMSKMSSLAPESIKQMLGDSAFIGSIETDAKTPDQVLSEFLEMVSEIETKKYF